MSENIISRVEALERLAAQNTQAITQNAAAISGLINAVDGLRASIVGLTSEIQKVEQRLNRKIDGVKEDTHIIIDMIRDLQATGGGPAQEEG
jgi:hypothetical protein